MKLDMTVAELAEMLSHGGAPAGEAKAILAELLTFDCARFSGAWSEPYGPRQAAEDYRELAHTWVDEIVDRLQGKARV